MKDLLYVAMIAVLTNASHTLVSRARNSNSYGYHAIAAVFSNGLWLLMIRKVAMNLDSTPVMIGYLVGSVTGSLLMHVIAMKYLEKKRS